MKRASRSLLTTLNRLEQRYGLGQHQADPNYDTPGEARARIEDLKEELAALGTTVRWDGHRYELEARS